MLCTLCFCDYETDLIKMYDKVDYRCGSVMVKASFTIENLLMRTASSTFTNRFIISLILARNYFFKSKKQQIYNFLCNNTDVIER